MLFPVVRQVASLAHSAQIATHVVRSAMVEVRNGEHNAPTVAQSVPIDAIAR